VFSVVAERRWRMKKFGWQVVGCSMPAMQRQERHGQSPRVGRCTDGTTSVMVVEERRWRRPSTSAVRRTLSARYGGADALRHRNARTQRRNWIRSGTRNQWSWTVDWLLNGRLRRCSATDITLTRRKSQQFLVQLVAFHPSPTWSVHCKCRMRK